MKPIDQTAPTAVAPDLATLARDNAAFAVDLYAKLRGAEGNVVFSPQSVSAVLYMLLAGASDVTATQIAQALHCSLPSDRIHHAAAALNDVFQQIARRGEVRLFSANALFPDAQYPLLPGFLAITKEYHGVGVTPLDYGQPERARETINSWVEQQTERRITALIPPGAITTLTRLVLTNAVYFKGNWAAEFDPDATRDAPFWLSAGESVDVPTMRRREYFRTAQTDWLQALELPYKGKNLSMLLILPNERDGLAEVEAELSGAALADLRKRLHHEEVDVFLPRFRVEWIANLNPVLMSLGMVDAFDQQRADFSRMDGRTAWLYVGLAVHKAFVEANEEGTEAAAATAVSMTLGRVLSEPRKPLEFRADHPFLFALIERQTGSILFMGRVVDPRADKGGEDVARRKGLARWFPWIGR